ncbi:hypothetical protein L6R53_29790 [Myxococcota bacterium]|nr:hypothetical protein [Myxococcota bacterium]
MILALLGAAALAATWTAPVPLPRVVDPDGLLLVPAGVAVRLEPGARDPLPTVVALPTTRNPETDQLQVLPGPTLPVDLRGVPEGLLIPLSDEPRLLRVDPLGGRPRVRLSTRREQLAAWQQVHRQAWRGDAEAIRLPWGGPAVQAEVRLRVRAFDGDEPDARRLRHLGTTADLAHLVPLHRTTHARASVAETVLGADEQWQVALQGPATVVLSLRPRADGAWARGALRLAVDGQAREVDPLVGAGTAWRREELFLGPGAHTLEVEVPGLPVQARVEVAALRRPLLGARLPGQDPPQEDPLARAERAWLRGDRPAALAGFRGCLDRPGAGGELARARVLALTEDPAELLALSALPEETSPDGRAVATAALLARAEELPPARVAALVQADPSPDPAAVARWLDGLGGQRSRGTALLRAARPLLDDGRQVHVDELRHRTVSTRFVRLEPLAGGDAEARDPATPAAAATRRLADSGPGVPRLAVDAGTGVDVDLPEWGERSPVLRLLLAGPARWRLDGQPWAAGVEGQHGELGVALAPGRHRLEVEAGTVYLVDPELAVPTGAAGGPAGAPTGGRRVWDRPMHALPARWSLPDPGASADLRLVVEPAVPVWVELDDGALHRLVPDTQGRVELLAGPWATLVRVRAEDPAIPVQAQLEQRLRDPAPGGRPPPPVTDVDAALAELADLSRTVDLGLPEARLARAALLGRMGQLRAARRDLRVLLEGPDPAMQAQARRLAANLVPVTPSAPILGPTSPAAALAMHQDPRPAPEGPPEARALALEALAREHGDDPALWRAAGEAWAETPHLAWAWQAADHAGASGDRLRRLLLGRTAWTALTWPSGGVGLVKVAVAPEDADPQGVDGGGEASPDDPLAPTWRRVRAALLGLPWPPGEEGTVLRGDLGELARAGPGELVVELFCRDEQGPGAPCEVPLRIDEVRTTVTVPDGRTEALHLPAARARREVEIGGPGPSHALAVRLRLDGAPLPRDVERTAHRAAAGRPLSYEVGGPLLVRVQALRGQGRVLLDGRAAGEVRAGGAPLVVAVAEPGAHQVRVEGEVDLQAWAGTRLPAAPEDEALALDEALPLDLLLPPAEALPVDVDAVFAHLGAPPLAVLRAPGRGGSVELAASAHAELLSHPTERWQAAQVGARWLQAGPRHFGQAGAWGRGLAPAGGALAEAGRTWARAFASAALFGAGATSITGPAGHLGGALRGRVEPSLGRTLDLRLDGRLRAAWSSAAPVARVDGQAWSQWTADHPLVLQGAVALVGSPTSDLRWEAGIAATSNSGPSLDRAGPFVGADLLLPTGAVLGVDGQLERRFADAHRDEASWAPRLELRAEQGLWDGQGRWWRPWARLGWRFDVAEPLAAAGLKLLLGPRRGLLDLPPASVAFRAQRERP